MRCAWWLIDHVMTGGFILLFVAVLLPFAPFYYVLLRKEKADADRAARHAEDRQRMLKEVGLDDQAV